MIILFLGIVVYVNRVGNACSVGTWVGAEIVGLM